MVVSKQELESNRDLYTVHTPAKAHRNNKALGSQCIQLFRLILCHPCAMVDFKHFPPTEKTIGLPSTARHAQSEAQKKRASNQVKVEYIQRQHPPQICTLYTLSRPVQADRGQRGACK